MSIKFQHCRGHGNEYVVVYFFERVGDQLPTHVHDSPEFHDVTCIHGAVRVVTEGEQNRALGPAEWCAIDGTKPHTVIALREGSITAHRYTNGRPAFYDQLPASELSGELP